MKLRPGLLCTVTVIVGLLALTSPALPQDAGEAARIQSLVERELKARYRGSVLGFLWSFINPLLQLGIYWFVFSYIMPTRGSMGMSPYALFLFTGILPWTWFSSSVMESSAILMSSANLIKKILFPAEVLPIVVVLSNLVHFFLGLPILFAFLIYYGKVQATLESSAGAR